MGMHNNWPYIINLGNSIIGVAVLAMPFCFQQCGILLGMLVLFFCTWLTLVSCKLLLKAGVASRRRSYEFLAYHTHGAPGKFITEVGMIGMQLGTLIAQMVVIGDLGPAIISKIFGFGYAPGMRTFLIVFLTLTVGLPMALLKDLRAVSKASTVCIMFYSVYVIYVLWLSIPSLLKGDWFSHVNFWRTEGLFRCLPIFSFSFGCQTQLFILYDALPEPSLKLISSVTSSAVNLCAVVYLLVGFLGYIHFHSFDIPGDVINIFPATFFTDVTKLCFVFSTVVTFPVIIFPCRASIYTLLFAKKSKPHDDMLSSNEHMPEKLFKSITVSIVLGSMAVSIVIPNVEFILGINGAIMGTLICYIFPALFFLKVMGSKPEEKSKAQLVLFCGITILLVSTFATLSSHDRGHNHLDEPSVLIPKNPTLAPLELLNEEKKPADFETEKRDIKTGAVDPGSHVRKEPPNPDPPEKVVIMPVVAENHLQEEVKGDNVEIKANEISNEELEIANKVKELEKEKKQDDLIAKLELHRVEQERLIEEQKQLLKEFKNHHELDMKEKIQQNLQQPQDTANGPSHQNNELPANPQQVPADPHLLPAEPQQVHANPQPVSADPGQGSDSLHQDVNPQLRQLQFNEQVNVGQNRGLVMANVTIDKNAVVTSQNGLALHQARDLGKQKAPEDLPQAEAGYEQSLNGQQHGLGLKEQGILGQNPPNIEAMALKPKNDLENPSNLNFPSNIEGVNPFDPINLAAKGFDQADANRQHFEHAAADDSLRLKRDVEQRGVTQTNDQQPLPGSDLNTNVPPQVSSIRKNELKDIDKTSQAPLTLRQDLTTRVSDNGNNLVPQIAQSSAKENVTPKVNQEIRRRLKFFGNL
ncbi:unnamed protein product [Lymnaea stagnalis]|uniref:Amino acid transporter transmembrane domain-containing protein n=1 Tax=Lymnaea stagnalis TaxID=6523 RepID=A0AAV2H7E7_LYMST